MDPQANKPLIDLHPNAFPYRAWAIMVTNDPEIFLEVVQRAVHEAPKYHVNRIEFHDFVYGGASPEGFVENVVRYEKFPGMPQHDSFRFRSFSVWFQENKPPVSMDELDRNVEHFRAAAKLVKEAGMKLNIWFHSFREIPEELEKAFPDLMNPESDFLFQASGWILDEFLEKVPEVDAITLTSLAETRSLAEMEGSSSTKERLEKFYRIAHGICKKHNRELILRDFGGTDDFWEVASKLPEDIRFMTKWMTTDWERVHHPLARQLRLAEGKRFVIEWDLRGEYLGEGWLPYVNPKHFWTALNNVKTFRPEGCVARIHWSDNLGKQHEWTPVFDAANGLNLHVYSLGMAGTDRERAREIPPAVHAELLPYSWIREWIIENYGPEAWPELYELFKDTPRVVEGIYVCADRFHSGHSFPILKFHPLIMTNFRNMLTEGGMDYILSSKAAAVHRARALRNAAAEIPVQPPERRKELLRSFDRMIAFAEMQKIWLPTMVGLCQWHDAGRTPINEGRALLDLAVRESDPVLRELGGGMEKMFRERMEEQLPRLQDWIEQNDSTSSQEASATPA